MTEHTYSLSLSRWHKVAERLARSYAELSQSTRNTLINTQVNGYLGETQVSRLHAVSEQQLANLERAFLLQDALVQIRQALGEANARVGVTKDLAEYDVLIRRQKFLESILLAQGNEMIEFSELPQLPKQLVVEDRYDRSRGAVKVRMLTKEAETKLRDQAEQLRQRVYALSDRISDLNRERLVLELPDDIARVAGL